ncbi:uncharacterized protein LOC126836257 [Adelges cooleyi]|uniref:uncharacterized protein LOC126836257 n=1 Tax=Adelges cooleyi TaxID=133065 RepID=UPI00218085A1|nr:uncharacterized protein LOC126836257 [Adelges cooleyi]
MKTKTLMTLFVLIPLLEQAWSGRPTDPKIHLAAALNRINHDLLKVGHHVVTSAAKILTSKEVQQIIKKTNILLVNVLKSLSTHTKQHLRQKSVVLLRTFSKLHELGLHDVRKGLHIAKGKWTKDSSNRLIVTNINTLSDVLKDLTDVIQPLNRGIQGNNKNINYVFKPYQNPKKKLSSLMGYT